MSDLIIRQLQELVASAVLFIPNFVAAVVVLLVTLYLGSLASRWLPRRVRERGGDPGTGLFDVTNRVTKALKEVAEKEGINLPYSIQTVYLRQLAA